MQKSMKQFSELAIKILGAYLVLSNLGNALPLFFTPESWGGGESLPVAPFIGWVVIPALIGIALWISARKMAPNIVSSSEEDTAISEGGVVAAGTFLIGVYWTLKSIGIVVGQMSTQGTINYGYVAVFIISFTLILGSKFVSAMYRRLRMAGTGA